jgi:hypothetical protein
MNQAMKIRCALLVGLVALTACGSKNDPMKAAFDHTETQVQAVSSASAIQCTTDRNVMDIAVETYLTLVGSLPTSEDDLVAQRVIREPSASYNVDSGGNVVPDPTGACAS